MACCYISIKAYFFSYLLKPIYLWSIQPQPKRGFMCWLTFWPADGADGMLKFVWPCLSLTQRYVIPQPVGLLLESNNDCNFNILLQASGFLIFLILSLIYCHVDNYDYVIPLNSRFCFSRLLIIRL